MITKVVHILDINIQLNYQFNDYFDHNIEKYEIDEKSSYKYKITSQIVEHISFELNEVYEIFSKTLSGDIKSAILIKDNHYIVYLLKGAFEDMINAEYIYMGIAYLKISLHEHYFPLHASTIVYKNQAIAFSASSKTGKSTHSSLWIKYIKGSQILNDDKTILTFNDKDIYAHGIPFSGAHKINLNQKNKLKAIVFLKQAKDNHIYKIEGREASMLLAKNIYQPQDGHIWQIVFDQIEKIINQIPIYILEANISEEAVLTVINELGGFEHEN
jgi:hypothetical protein